MKEKKPLGYLSDRAKQGHTPRKKDKKKYNIHELLKVYYVFYTKNKTKHYAALKKISNRLVFS